MRLEMASFPVRRAELGARTAYAEGLLTIDAGAIRTLVLRDPRIADLQLELLHPGESTRVLRVLDAVEPLAKVVGPSTAFPGFLGPPLTCGAGRTHRLAGFAVVQVTEFPFPARGVQAFEEGIVEMSGPGALYSGCADRVGLCLVLTPGRTSSNVDYDDAVRRATLLTAQHLAAATSALPPPDLETFELGAARPRLPRVVWVHQMRAQGPMIQSFLYGHEASGIVPTLLHPNELLDGALVGANYKTGTKTPTYLHTRHPALLSLYGRHGRDLTFAGVVVSRGHWETEALKQRSAAFAAKVAVLAGADAALCTIEATGNGLIDFMLTVEALERTGVVTAAVVHEYGGPDGTDATLLDFVPEAVALASCGGIDRRVRLPAVSRVIGGATLKHRGEDATGELDLPIQELYAATGTMDARGVIARDDGAGRRLNDRTDRPASDRALGQALARLRKEPFTSEVPLPRYDPVPPPPAADASSVRLALVSECGLVPRGNPDGLEWVRASKWLRYTLDGKPALATGEYEVVHGGYDAAAATGNPNRLIPLDAVRDLVERREIGTLLETYYVTAGNHGILGRMTRYGREIASELLAQKVGAALLVAT